MAVPFRSNHIERCLLIINRGHGISIVIDPSSRHALRIKGHSQEAIMVNNDDTTTSTNPIDEKPECCIGGILSIHSVVDEITLFYS